MSRAEMQQAIDNELVMAFQYRKPTGEQSYRTFSPWEFIGAQRQTVRGWDHDRDEIRAFSLEGIIDVSVSYPGEIYVLPQT